MNDSSKALFWTLAEQDLEENFGKANGFGPPSTWRKPQMRDFLYDLEDQLTLICQENKALAESLNLAWHNGKLSDVPKIGLTTFYRYFRDKDFQKHRQRASDTNCDKLAIYLGRAWNCRGYLHYNRKKKDLPTTPPLPTAPGLSLKISERFTALKPATFVGRKNVINQLTEKIQSKARLILLYGLTGIGKTALAEKMVEEIGAWEKVDNQQLFMADFYKNETRTSFRDFANHLIEDLGIEIHDPKIGPQDLLMEILNFLKKNRCFLLINSIEYLLLEHQQQSSIIFKDQQWNSFFQQICQANTFRSIVLLTSQVKPDLFIDLNGRYANAYQSLLSGLPVEVSLELFKKRGIAVRKNSQAERYLTRIAKVFAGHPLALETIAGEMLEDDKQSVEAFWNRNKKEIITAEQSRANLSNQQNPEIAIHQLVKEHLNRRIQNTFERLKEANYQAFRILLAIARYPTIHRTVLFDLCQNRFQLSEETSRKTINTLTKRFLLSKRADQFNQHDLIRSMSFYYRKKLQRGHQN